MENNGYFSCDIAIENGQTLRASYCVTKALFTDGEFSAEVYGIECTVKHNEQSISQSHVADISPNANFVCSLAQTLCAGKVTPLHLHDLISDAIH